MADQPYEPDEAPFSARYSIVRGANVRTWREDEAHMDEALFRGLARRYGTPVVGYVGGLHYAFKPSKQVLSGEAAIPKSKHGSTSEPSALLIQK